MNSMLNVYRILRDYPEAGEVVRTMGIVCAEARRDIQKFVERERVISQTDFYEAKAIKVPTVSRHLSAVRDYQ